MTISDAALIQASWDDPETFAAVFDRHFTTIFMLCSRKVGSSGAEDAAGETFRRAFEHRRRYDPSQADARGWLVSIALNVVRDTFRSSDRRTSAYLRLAQQHREPPDVGTQIAASIDAQRRVKAVGDLLGQCPSEEVETLLLHVWDGLSYEEVAVALNIPVGTVRSRLNRLRARLRMPTRPTSATHVEVRPRPIARPLGANRE